MGTTDEGKAFSVELCGGTHAGRTGDIGLVSVAGESAVAAGVRRLEATTGTGARRVLNEDSRRLRELASLLKVPASEAETRLAALLEERRKLERDLSDARKKLAMGGGGSEADPIREVAGTKLLARAVAGVEMKDLKSLADEAKARVGSGVVAIIGVSEDGKAGVVVGVTEELKTAASTRSHWCASPQRRSAARAAAAGATWRRPAVPTATRRKPRSTPSRPRWAEPRRARHRGARETARSSRRRRHDGAAPWRDSASPPSRTRNRVSLRRQLRPLHPCPPRAR